jgi:hypothetical protein
MLSNVASNGLKSVVLSVMFSSMFPAVWSVMCSVTFSAMSVLLLLSHWQAYSNVSMRNFQPSTCIQRLSLCLSGRLILDQKISWDPKYFNP